MQVLALLLLPGALRPMPIVRLVPMGLFFTWGSLHHLRASFSRFFLVFSILQSQDGSMEDCKALSGRVAGEPLGSFVAPGQVHPNHPPNLLKQGMGPIPGESVGLEWRPENVHF